MHPIRAIVAFFRVLFGRSAAPEPAELPEPAPVPEPVEVAGGPSEEEIERLKDEGALRLLHLLQQRGRLVDFLQEEVADFTDAQVGAAVRAIHKGCRAVLDEYLPVAAVVEGEEDGPFTVEAGFDPRRIRLLGKVRGEAPFQGTLRHHGWQVTGVELAYPAEEIDPRVVAAAEVEL